MKTAAQEKKKCAGILFLTLILFLLCVVLNFGEISYFEKEYIFAIITMEDGTIIQGRVEALSEPYYGVAIGAWDDPVQITIDGITYTVNQTQIQLFSAAAN